jgi:hypothetical protein
MVKAAMIKIILSIVVTREWSLCQLSDQIAFLHEYLEEEEYMRQPPGFENKIHPNYVCRLDKALYGLKQAPRAWFAKLSKKLCDLGFKGSKDDASLFYYNKNSIFMFILVYVDGIYHCNKLYTRSCDSCIERFEERFLLEVSRGAPLFSRHRAEQGT